MNRRRPRNIALCFAPNALSALTVSFALFSPAISANAARVKGSQIQ
jgi:hypothetical protein